MAYCDKCGNFDKSHAEDFDLKLHSSELHYQPDLYYYWDSPIEEDYDWRTHQPSIECLCEICFDILNFEGKILWKDDKNPFECASVQTGTQFGCFLAPSDYNQSITNTFGNYDY